MNRSEPTYGRSHAANEHEASNGAGTVSAPPRGETLDHPVLDGSTEHFSVEEAIDKNARFADEDPGLVRHPETGEKTPVPDETDIPGETDSGS